MNVHEASKILLKKIQGIKILYYYKLKDAIVFEVTDNRIPNSNILTTNATYYAVNLDGYVEVVNPMTVRLDLANRIKYSV